MDNYTGPMWSNGELQSSVEFGDKMPTSYLDSQSRLHDSAYAKFGDKWHREAADMIYRDALEKSGGMDSVVGQLPLYGNYTKQQVYGLVDKVKTGLQKGGLLGALGGAILHEGQYIADQMHRLSSNNLAKERANLLAYYASDPLRSTHQFSLKPALPQRDSMPRGGKVVPLQLPTIDATKPFMRSDLSNKMMNAYIDEHPGPTFAYQSHIRPYKIKNKRNRKHKN